jgi:hypothetical protein
MRLTRDFCSLQAVCTPARAHWYVAFGMTIGIDENDELNTSAEKLLLKQFLA